MVEEIKIFRKFRKRDIMVARFIAILILGGMVTYGISSISEEEKVNQDKQNSVDKFAYDRAQDIASSVADILLMRLSDEETYGVNTAETENLPAGKITYIVEDNFNEDDNLIEIKVTAKSKDITTVITTDINRETKRKERINVKYLYD